MSRKIVKTEDGSYSIYVDRLGEYYHSHFGAIQESNHIFIDSALSLIEGEKISVLEFGFGTGLNALLTYDYAIQNSKNIYYCGLEKYPLSKEEVEKISFPKSELNNIHDKLHRADWGLEVNLGKNFTILKEKSDFRDYKSGANKFDVVYYDAFAPDVQPHLWTEEILKEIYDSMNIGGVLTTYTVKGKIRRMLKSVGFIVEKIPGPPGKREITRAFKIASTL